MTLTRLSANAPCPFCGSTAGLIDLHGSMTCVTCKQKVEGCCGGNCNI